MDFFILKITRITSVANSIRVTKNEPFGRARYRSLRSEQKQNKTKQVLQ